MAQRVRLAAVSILIYCEALRAVTVVICVCVLAVLLTSVVLATPVLALWFLNGWTKWRIGGPAHCFVVSLDAQSGHLSRIWICAVCRALHGGHRPKWHMSQQTADKVKWGGVNRWTSTLIFKRWAHAFVVVLANIAIQWNRAGAVKPLEVFFALTPALRCVNNHGNAAIDSTS